MLERQRQKGLQNHVLAATPARGIAEFAAKRQMAVAVHHRPYRDQQPLAVGAQRPIRRSAGGGADRVFEYAKGLLGDAHESGIAVVVLVDADHELETRRISNRE